MGAEGFVDAVYVPSDSHLFVGDWHSQRLAQCDRSGDRLFTLNANYAIFQEVLAAA